MDAVQQHIDKLYKEHFGKLVALLLYNFRDMDPGNAEDFVQDAFSAALTNWRLQGIPDNASGWIYTVCRNKALNQLKKNKRIQPFDVTVNHETTGPAFSERLPGDPQLILLFSCAHPDLSPKEQLVITLKYVINLKVAAIAKVLGMTIDGADKLLVRARQKIKTGKILFEAPHPSALQPRLPIVHKIIYLVFNEGYKTSWGKELIREELCEEALLLNQSLMDAGLANKDTTALHALMLFNSARFVSRFGSSGELLELEKQDRSTWNTDLIQLGCQFLRQSQDARLSSYHLEAAIACLHCTATSFAATDWKMIADLYARLLQQQPNPFASLNYAIALYHAKQPQACFSILNELLRNPFMAGYYLLNYTAGKLYKLQGQPQLAKQFLEKALLQTNAGKEKDSIREMLDKPDHTTV